jgi:TonB family protein
MSVSGSAESVAVFLFGNSLRAAVLFCVAWAITPVARKRSAALRHQIWLAALFACLLLPVLSPLLPAWHSTALASAVARVSAASPSAAQRATGPAFVVNAASSASSAVPWLQILLLVWAAGCGVLLARLTAGFVRMAVVGGRSKPLVDEDWAQDVARLSKVLGISRGVRLLQTDDTAAMPLAWGLLQPKILVPSSAREWPSERRRIVLLHELSHIARRDCAAQIAGEVVRALHWFNPLAWLAVARLRYESECACDDSVLNSGIEGPAYAGELLALARTLDHRTSVWQPALAMARSAHLERRFTAMLNSMADRRVASRSFRLFTAFAALCLLLPLAAFRVPGQNAAGTVSGTVYDSNGAPAPNATVMMIDLATNLRDMTVSDGNGHFQLAGLPPGQYELVVMKQGFATYDVPTVSMEPSRGLSLDAKLEPGQPQEKTGAQKAILVSGNVEQTNLFTRVMPVYPKSAKTAGVQGDVTLRAVIGKDGTPLLLVVKNADANPELARAAVEAVSHWRYRPTLLNGDPIGVDTDIDVGFHLYR